MGNVGSMRRAGACCIVESAGRRRLRSSSLAAAPLPRCRGTIGTYEETDAAYPGVLAGTLVGVGLAMYVALWLHGVREVRS